MGLSENVTALATRLATEFKSVRAAMVTKAIVDVKGDLIAATGADAVARVPVGATTGHVLTVDPASSVGISWQPPAGGAPSNMVTTDGGTSAAPQIITGVKSFSKSLTLDALDSTEAAPRTLGITNFNVGRAARWEIGDSLTSLQSAFGSRLQLQAYHGIEILGGRSGPLGTSTPAPFKSGASNADPSLTVRVVGAPAQPGLQVNHEHPTPTGDIAQFAINGVVKSRVGPDGGLYDNGNRAYSDSNPPESLERTLLPAGPTAASNPIAGRSWEWTPDGRSLWMEAPDGTRTLIGPSTGGGGGGSSVLKTAADQAFSTVTLAPITGWTVPLPAGEVETIEASLYLSVPATTTGWQLAAVPRTVGGGAALTPVRFVAIFEYQTSATAWATFTQNVPTTYMAVTAASPVVNAAFLVRISAQVEAGTTAGELQFQLRTEVAGSAVTSRKGNTLRYF